MLYGAHGPTSSLLHHANEADIKLADVVKEVLKYIYTHNYDSGEDSISAHNATAGHWELSHTAAAVKNIRLYALEDYYDIPDLRERACRELKIDVERCSVIMIVAIVQAVSYAVKGATSCRSQYCRYMNTRRTQPEKARPG